MRYKTILQHDPQPIPARLFTALLPPPASAPATNSCTSPKQAAVWRPLPPSAALPPLRRTPARKTPSLHHSSSRMSTTTTSRATASVQQLQEAGESPRGAHRSGCRAGVGQSMRQHGIERLARTPGRPSPGPARGTGARRGTDSGRVLAGLRSGLSTDTDLL